LKGLNIQDCMVHINPAITPEIEEYATDDVFLDSRYIFTTRQGKRQYGYCTHCQSEYLNDKCLRHGDEVKCPVCHSNCIVRSEGRGHKHLVDEAYFTFYEKSIIDPNAIVAKGVFAVRDYGKSYQNVKTTYLIAAMYVFVPGLGGTMLKRKWFWYGYDGMNQGHLIKAASARMLKKEHFYKFGFRWTYSRESIAEAVKGTPFQYSTWEHYEHDDMTAFFDLYSRYPCVEYLTKLGFGSLVQMKLNGYPTHGALYWHGKNLLKVLRLTKQDFTEIKKQKIIVNFDFLKTFQISKKLNWDLSLMEIDKLSVDFGAYYLDVFKTLTEIAPVRQILTYLQKQCENDKGSMLSRLNDYRDYINECKQLKMDLTNHKVVFPKDLIAAHQETTVRIKFKSDKELAKKFKIQAKKLQKYYFEFEGLFIRPPQHFKELLNEGNTLHHCVATYTKQHAEGKTGILFIRNSAQPEKPFYTVEISKDRVMQVQGDHHREPTPEVKEFMEAFEAAKLGKKIKVRIPA
jgi:hypothetical protein